MRAARVWWGVGVGGGRGLIIQPGQMGPGQLTDGILKRNALLRIWTPARLFSPDISAESAAPPRELHLLQKRGKEDRRRGRKARNVHGYGRAISYGFRVSPRFDAALQSEETKPAAETLQTFSLASKKKKTKK